jgi:hypothetical protein
MRLELTRPWHGTQHTTPPRGRGVAPAVPTRPAGPCRTGGPAGNRAYRQGWAVRGEGSRRAVVRAPERWDLIWLSFTPQSGREQSGRRPALVVSPSTYNSKVGLALVCPITSRAVAVRKDVTFWRRFIPPLPRLLGGLFAGLLMVH